jgi:hypothetical protein
MWLPHFAVQYDECAAPDFYRDRVVTLRRAAINVVTTTLLESYAEHARVIRIDSGGIDTDLVEDHLRDNMVFAEIVQDLGDTLPAALCDEIAGER